MVLNKGKKRTGGRYIRNRKKKSFELAGQKRIIKIGDDKIKTRRVRGGNIKIYLLRGKTINLRIKDKIKRTLIKNVLETPSNKFLARQNILTKGTIVDTELGKAKITNRPTQEGVINGILLEN